MAEQIISPGVFTRENDLSFLPAGLGAIGAAIIGPTVKGPAFIPTVVNSFADYERKFGPLNSDTFIPQTIREYLKNAGTVTVCRVLAGGGYKYDSSSTPSYITAGDVGVGNSAVQGGFAIGNYAPGNGVLLGAIFPSKNTSTPDLSTTKIISTITSASSTVNISGSVMSGSFKIILQGTNSTTTTLSASMDPSSGGNYLFRQLGYTPDNSKSGTVLYAGTPGYTYLNFKTLQTDAIAADVNALTSSYASLTSASILTPVSSSGTALVFSGSIGPENYSYASTPMIVSNLQGSYPSQTTKELFQFHTIAHGTSTNTNYKISIGCSTFTANATSNFYISGNIETLEIDTHNIMMH